VETGVPAAPPILGAQFEAEIRQQPGIWRELARSGSAARLTAALADRKVLLVGSGSSLFVAQLGALALRRRRIAAQALAATEARFDHRAYAGWTVLAVSQSGRSSDVLAAIEHIRPPELVVLTNAIDSPLADRAACAIDIGAGRERAIPAGKSVSASVALLLWSAALLGGIPSRDAGALEGAADAIEAWFAGPGLAGAIEAAQQIARMRSVLMLGTDYGIPIAGEAALKFKEAAYVHAEGFAAGEFRHGSRALLDATCAVIGLVDTDGLPIVSRPLDEALSSGAARYTIGSERVPGIAHLGPEVAVPFNTLAWLVTAQMLALHAARARGIDSDHPRGLTKTLVTAPLAGAAKALQTAAPRRLGA
jgi:glucosamine--fructose-6-phosphate aminotransferase (isomerizing)